jgi:hypothetical protein
LSFVYLSLSMSSRPPTLYWCMLTNEGSYQHFYFQWSSLAKLELKVTHDGRSRSLATYTIACGHAIILCPCLKLKFPHIFFFFFICKGVTRVVSIFVHPGKDTTFVLCVMCFECLCPLLFTFSWTMTS